MPNTDGAPSNLSFTLQAPATTNLKTWNLGYDSQGSWAQLDSVNSRGVAVGWGDVNGETRMLGVALFGPNAGRWFDSGLSSDDVDGWSGEGGRISDSGLIVGGIRGANGHAMAYVWTPNHGGTELGTLGSDEGSVAPPP